MLVHETGVNRPAATGIERLSAIWVCTKPDAQRPLALAAYLRALAALPCASELTIVVNGAEVDPERELLPHLPAGGVPTTVVSLHRRCDEATAIGAGLRVSGGDVLALLPEYLQADAAALQPMLERIVDGAGYVATWRVPRVDSRWNHLKSVVFNRLTSWLTSTELHDVNSGLRMVRREVTQHVPIYGELHRFWPILAAQHGFRVDEVQVRHLEERVARGDYHAGVYLRRVLDLLTLFFLSKFTRRPLRFFGLLGSATLATGLLLTGVLFGQGWFGTPMLERPLLILAVLLVVLGIQLFSLGLLGELIIFTQGKGSDDYHVETIHESPRDP